jgi:hypothetical protein
MTPGKVSLRQMGFSLVVFRVEVDNILASYQSPLSP